MDILSLLLAAVLSAGAAGSITPANTHDAGSSTSETGQPTAEEPPPPSDDARANIIEIG